MLIVELKEKAKELIDTLPDEIEPREALNQLKACGSVLVTEVFRSMSEQFRKGKNAQ